MTNRHLRVIDTAVRRDRRAAATQHPTLSPDERKGLPPRRVLLVEDHPGNQELLLRLLTDLGFAAVVAETAREAVRLAQTERPDLILMDILLAQGDGRDAARQLRGMVETARIPILAITALALPGDRERCLAAGCTDYLSKPFTPQQLRAKIGELLPRDAA